MTKRDIAGFSLIESMVAVTLLAVVGVIVTQVVQKNLQSNVWNEQRKRAALLADQVFEKYDYLATIQFDTLEQFDQTHVTPASFFSTGFNNEGYNSMWLTTRVEAATSTGSRKLAVTVTWSSEAPSNTLTFWKYLSAGAGTQGGAPVHVYIVDAAGNGLAGFEVRATHNSDPNYRNEFGTNEVVGYTDASGMVTLLNVSVDPSHQPMSIYAKKPGSASNIRQSDALYSAGYFAPGPQAWNYKTLNVSQVAANVVSYSEREGDFTPLGRISGVVVNPVDGVVDGMKISAIGLQSDGSVVESTTTSVLTQVGASGAYEFNNIGPGLLQLAVEGITGSTATIPVSDPSYVQGYAGFNGNGGFPWVYAETFADPPSAISDVELSVRKLGSLVINTKDLMGADVANASITVTPEYTFPVGTYPLQVNSGGGATVTLNNIAVGDSEDFTLSATLAPNGCVDLGKYLFGYVASGSANTSTSITLNLKNGVQVSGTLQSSIGLPLSGANVVANSLLPGTTTMATTDAAGAFALCGLADDPGGSPGWPNLNISITDSSHRLRAQFSGTVSEQYYGRLIAGRQILPTSTLPSGSYVHNSACATDPSPSTTTSDTINTNGSGQYGPVCGYFPIISTMTVPIAGATPAYSAGTISVSTGTTQGGLQMVYDGAYYHGGNVSAISNNGIYTSNMSVSLLRQYVSGTVTDSVFVTGLAGIPVNYPCTCVQGVCDLINLCTVTTNASGDYGPLEVVVVGRDATHPGTATVSIPDGVSPTASLDVYGGATGTVTVATPCTPKVAISKNLSLVRYAGGL